MAWAEAPPDDAVWSDVAPISAPWSKTLIDIDFTTRGSAFDSTLFGAITANGGTVTQTAGVGVVLDSSSANDCAAAMYYKTKFDKTLTRTLEWWVHIHDMPDDGVNMYFAYAQSTAPTSGGVASLFSARRIYPVISAAAGGAGAIYHKNAAGTQVAETVDTGGYITFDAVCRIRFENSPDHSGGAAWRVSMLKVDGTLMGTGGWILWSDTQAATGDLWTVVGDLLDDVTVSTRMQCVVSRFIELSTVAD